jgi:hypothetical protein
VTDASVIAETARACQGLFHDHGTRSRSQIRIEATPTVARHAGEQRPRRRAERYQAFLDKVRGRDDVSFALVVGLLGAETHRRADVKAALAGQ